MQEPYLTIWVTEDLRKAIAVRNNERERLKAKGKKVTEA